MRKLLPTIALLAALLVPAQARAGTHWVSPRHTWGRWQRFYVTGYSWESGTITATGVRVHLGVAAVDPNVIPLHSVLQVRGIGTFTALDTGGMIIGHHIDLWWPTASLCYAHTGWYLVRTQR